MKRLPKIDDKKFIESIYHLVYFGNILRNYKNTFNRISSKINKNDFRVIQLSIQWNTMVMAVSFQDELTKYLLRYEPLDNNLNIKIDSFRNIIQPAIMKLQSWEGLRNFRNNALAHNF